MVSNHRFPYFFQHPSSDIAGSVEGPTFEESNRLHTSKASWQLQESMCWYVLHIVAHIFDHQSSSSLFRMDMMDMMDMIWWIIEICNWQLRPFSEAETQLLKSSKPKIVTKVDSNRFRASHPESRLVSAYQPTWISQCVRLPFNHRGQHSHHGT